MAESIDELRESVAELKGRLDEISRKQDKPREKSWLDVLSPLSTFLSGVLIAAVGTIATVWYQNQQVTVQHLNALDKYRPYVTSGDPVLRTFGYRAFIKLGEEQLVLDLVASKSDAAGLPAVADIITRPRKAEETPRSDVVQTAEDVGNQLQKEAVSSDQAQVPKSFVATEETPTREGWAYLGQYLKNEKTWKTRYFDIGPATDPATLEGEWLVVRQETGSLNVRKGMPTATARFLDVIDVLDPGSKARILEVDEWYATGYMWARIAYGT